jgi:hypothetical protein
MFFQTLQDPSSPRSRPLTKSPCICLASEPNSLQVFFRASHSSQNGMLAGQRELLCAPLRATQAIVAAEGGAADTFQFRLAFDLGVCWESKHLGLSGSVVWWIRRRKRRQ